MSRHFALAVMASFLLLAPHAQAARSEGQPCAHQSGAVELCETDGKLNMTQAKALRDEMLTVDVSEARLQRVEAELNRGRARCSSQLDIADASFLGTLYVLLGKGFLSIKDVALALEAFGTADTIFERSNAPNFMWLQSLELSAQAEIDLKNLERANEMATEQINLARSWVYSADFPKNYLDHALRFRANILRKKGDLIGASALVKEADGLDVGRQ